MTKTAQFVMTLLLATCATSAFAQDPEKPEKIVLDQKVGSVMASTGGDYESAGVGKILVRDESLMVADGAKATVVYFYDNGKRKCTEVYQGPNTFIIDDSCTKAAYISSSKGGLGILAGAALIGAAIAGSGDGVPPSPISGGSR